MKSVRLAIGFLGVVFCALPAAAQAPGAIRTVDSGGGAASVFSSRDSVYLAAGGSAGTPCQSSDLLSDGSYYFQVTDASGQRLLSTDTVAERVFFVRGGLLVSTFPPPAADGDGSGGDGSGAGEQAAAATHVLGPSTACGARSIALAPFADVGAAEASYLVWITPASQFTGTTSAVDSPCGAGCFHGFHPETSVVVAFRVEDKRNCQPTFCVSGIKFEDRNGNGIRDAGEPGIGGVLIRAEGGSGPALTGLTGADGSFRVCGLTDGGTFHVTERVPNGYLQTGPLNHRISRRLLAKDLGYFIAVCDEDFSGLDFGNQLIPNAIGGIKFEDLNANGVKDPGEPPLAGVTINYFPGTPANPGTSRSAVTDANGNFLFTNATPGPFFLVETAPAGFTQTLPLNGAITGTLTAGGSLLNNVFGNFRGILTGTVTGGKFLDLNGNGTREAGEPAQAGVTFTISGPAGFTPRTVVSGVDGTFTFTGVPFGIYTVTETVPSGFKQTAPASPGTASATLNVQQQTVSGMLFGNQALVQPATIRGTKFIDTNGNGVRDAGEPGGSGVTIHLLAPGIPGAPPSTSTVDTTTAADGSFSFTGLAPGTYVLTESVPTGYVQTAPGGAGTIAIALGSGEVRTGVLFGNQLATSVVPGSVSGLKILDFNTNGVVDGIDRPLEGIVFDLAPVSGSGATVRVTSGADGTFRFDNVPPGSYTLTEELPSNFFQTFPGTPHDPKGYDVTVLPGQNAGPFMFLNKC